jgi:very-short-patch-repair endonuclease
VRSRPALRATEIVFRQNIPVTDIVRTLIDLAAESDSAVVERAVNEADKRNLITPDTLRLRLADHAGEAGVRPLRQLLDKYTFRLSDSDLEVLLRPIAKAAGLPTPSTKQIVNGFEVDFFWADLGLVVETDGLRYHRTPSTQARDARRDRTHVLAGMTPLRFTHYEIKHESHQVRGALERAARLLRKRKQL